MFGIWNKFGKMDTVFVYENLKMMYLFSARHHSHSSGFSSIMAQSSKLLLHICNITFYYK